MVNTIFNINTIKDKIILILLQKQIIIF